MIIQSHWPKAGASIAVFKANQVLLVKRSKPPKLWSLPGGHIEPGETAAEAALRELTEETSVTANLVGLNDIVDAIFHEDEQTLRAHYLIASFVGTWISGTPLASDDADDAIWVHPDDLGKYDMTANAANLIESAWIKLTQS